MQQQGGTELTIAEAGSVPFMTMLLIFSTVIVFYMMESNRMEFWVPNVAAINWMERNACQSIAVAQWFRDHGLAEWLKPENMGWLVSRFLFSALASFTGWQLLLNSWFIWIFGSQVEQKLGPARYFLVVVLCIYAPYAALAYDHFNHVDPTIFYGPLYLIAGLIGAGLVFPEPKKVNIWFKRTRGEIFQRAPTRDPAAKFKVNKMLFALVWAAYNAGLFFYFNSHYTEHFETFDPLATFIGFGLGYGVSLFLVWSATGDLKDGPIKLMCIRKYNSVLRLDVGHELAVRSTSMALGLPEDRVRQWVASQKGKMQVR